MMDGDIYKSERYAYLRRQLLSLIFTCFGSSETVIYPSLTILLPSQITTRLLHLLPFKAAISLDQAISNSLWSLVVGTSG